MPKPNAHKTSDGYRTVRSAPALLWEEARNVMLTDNSMLDPQDPLSCMDLVVTSQQVSNVRRCIKTLYQGLRWASLLQIKGGFAGQRDYSRLFLIDDPYIIGVFDNRNTSGEPRQSEQQNPKTLPELIRFFNQGKGNIKTLVVFEKENLRLANSDEKARQSYFVAETIYPALAAIVQMLAKSESQVGKYLSGDLSTEKKKADSDEMQLTKATDDISQAFLKLSPLFIGIFKDSRQTDELLLETSPLLLFCNSSSPLNLDIDDDFFAESMSGISETHNADKKGQ